ncbi:hypothetical protein HGP14_08220 [Rhizobium sp. P32RR-XVIII]|uniref:hypothetical protein n=1 Tax=Rhizobium sp. P32RR-XVIII TaxID=2726738 RepID=UPI0014575D19|nr:hypothetical protein [Rhizobium sp. P32RR-XVIII]NLS03353.1 hypothetical protein [Rhizobium sp. P32RR-XVIII]
MSRLSSGASADPLQRNTAPARFTIGRNRRGQWIVADRDGLVGGLFINESAALHFAAAECNHNPADICRADGLVPDSALLSTPEPRMH